MHCSRCAMNRFAHTLVRPAPTYGIRHSGINFLIGGIRMRLEKRHRCHDHSWLAIPALRHIFFEPCFLAGVFTVSGEAFNRRVAPSIRLSDRDLTRTNSGVSFMNRARPTHSHAAAELGSSHLEQIA